MTQQTQARQTQATGSMRDYWRRNVGYMAVLLAIWAAVS
jgi:uncharacterized membrane protein